MNKDDIIRMAREADLPSCHTTHPKALERFANLVAAKEREACAQIAFNSATYIEAAKAIRERGE